MDSNGSSSPVAFAPARASWTSAWPDALALGIGLAMAWVLKWQVRDLVWSLWLSSLVVGYAIIVWKIFGPLVALRRAAATPGVSPGAKAAGAGLHLVGGLFLLAFFTVHFGMFHFIHSIFLNFFFPALPGRAQGFPSLALYGHVAASYWPFVLVAAVAERGAFTLPTAPLVGLGAGAAGGSGKSGDAFMEPYKNVVRMHLLIFFFVFAHLAHLENFLVYAVVYAAYFFPWRLLKRGRPQAA